MIAKLEALKITGPKDYLLFGRSVTKSRVLDIFQRFSRCPRTPSHQTSHLKEDTGLHVRFEDVSWSNTHDSCPKVKVLWSVWYNDPVRMNQTGD